MSPRDDECTREISEAQSTTRVPTALGGVRALANQTKRAQFCDERRNNRRDIRACAASVRELSNCISATRANSMQTAMLRG